MIKEKEEMSARYLNQKYEEDNHVRKIIIATIFSLTILLAFMFTAALAEGAVEKSIAFIPVTAIEGKHSYDSSYGPCVNINKHDVTLKKGKSETLKATLLPSGKPVSVTWESSNPKIAKVSSSGKVTAVAPGTAVISIYSEEHPGFYDKTGRSWECFVTVPGGTKDAKPIGASDRTYFYGKTKLTAPTSNIRDALAKVKKSIGGYSYKENDEYEGYYDGLIFGAKEVSKAHTDIFAQVTEEGIYFKFGYAAWNEKSPIKTSRGIVIGSKKNEVQQKYGLPSYTGQFTYNGKAYETFTYVAKATGTGLYTNFSFHFLKSKGTVSTIAFTIGGDYL